MGDFSSSASSMIPMEYIMIMSFIAQLLYDARELVAEISVRTRPERRDTRKGDPLDHTNIAGQAVIHRAGSLVKMTHNIPRTLIQLGIQGFRS